MIGAKQASSRRVTWKLTHRYRNDLDCWPDCVPPHQKWPIHKASRRDLRRTGLPIHWAKIPSPAICSNPIGWRCDIYLVQQHFPVQNVELQGSVAAQSAGSPGSCPQCPPAMGEVKQASPGWSAVDSDIDRWWGSVRWPAACMGVVGLQHVLV